LEETSMGGSSSQVAPEEGKHGKEFEHDPNFNGPITQGRKCRDVLCLLFFVVFWGVWIIGAYLAFSDGCPDNCNTPLRLVYGYDSAGQMCGGANHPDRKRMWIGLPYKITTSRVCMATCPETTGAQICVTEQMMIKENPSTLDKLRTCFAFDPPCCYTSYKTTETLFKCVPYANVSLTSAAGMLPGNTSNDQWNSAVSFAENPSGAFGTAVGQMVQYWVVILGSVIVALILGFVWLLFLRLFVGVMVWVTVVGFLLLLIACTVLAWEKAGVIDLSSTPAGDQSANNPTTGVALDETTAKIIAAVFSVVTGLYLLLFCIFLQRIRIAVQIIKEAAKAMAAVPFTVLYPLVTFVSLVCLLIWWVAVMLFLASAGEFDPKTMTFVYPSTDQCIIDVQALGTADGNIIFDADAKALCSIYKGKSATAYLAWQDGARATDNGNSTGLVDTYKTMLPVQLNGDTYNFFLLYHVFGGLWTYAFVIYFSYLTLAGTVAAWYWAKDKKKLGNFPVLDSMKRVIKYHLGSVAFGSFIIAVVRMIRLMFNYMMRRMQRFKDNPVVKVFICVVNCCLKCLERFINFINKNAYIMIAIHGKAFCPSAKDAFMLLMRNILRVAAINVIGDVMLFIGKLFVMFGTLLASWAYFNAIKDDPTLLPAAFRPSGPIDTMPIFPLIMCGIVGFIIGNAFMSVFEVAIDTIFLSFCEDLERNDGSAAKPYYMSAALKDICGKKNEEDKKGKKKKNEVAPAPEDGGASAQGDSTNLT